MELQVYNPRIPTQMDKIGLHADKTNPHNVHKYAHGNYEGELKSS